MAISILRRKYEKCALYSLFTFKFTPENIESIDLIIYNTKGQRSGLRDQISDTGFRDQIVKWRRREESFLLIQNLFYKLIIEEIENSNKWLL